MPDAQETYVVTKTRRETSSIMTLQLATQTGSIPPFLPGQVIDAYFPDTGHLHGKPYSISSAQGESMLTITVHAIGEFSNRLCTMHEGDVFTGSLPYGSFRPQKETSDVVMLASGMGVTPFRSIIKHASLCAFPGRMALFHTAKKLDDLLFRTELSSHARFLSTWYFVTREESRSIPTNLRSRRMCAKEILDGVTDLSRTEFLICGSFSFTTGMQKELTKCGAPKEAIRTSTISPVSGVFC